MRDELITTAHQLPYIDLQEIFAYNLSKFSSVHHDPFAAGQRQNILENWLTASQNRAQFEKKVLLTIYYKLALNLLCML